VKRFNSIKKNEDFKYVYKNGVSYANKHLVMYVLRKDSDKKENIENRIGISVSKKVGNSVVRHRLTRLVRESFRLNESNYLFSADIVVVVRVSSKEAGYKEIYGSYIHLCKIHNLIS
jgi:ribonuclease P protein component